ncbi:MAG: hypothetical protein Q7S21_04905 [archaeon]|nr:hypothetical protein [archaeon]
MYRVFHSVEFDETFKKLEKIEQERINKFEDQLTINPFVGKPLGFKFFREKKFNGKRMLYLIYEEFASVLLATIADKKSQQTEIDKIKENFATYKQFITYLNDKI